MRRKKLIRPRGQAKAETWYEVFWSVWHHGQYSPDRPWCLILRSDPGAVPGEPRDGIRYMRSFETRERAIAECAKEWSHGDRRVKAASLKLENLRSAVTVEMTARLEAELPHTREAMIAAGRGLDR